MYSLRYGVVLATLMTCVAFTAVGSSRNSRDGVQERGTPQLAISDEQREHIFETAPAAAAKFFDEPKREVDDDRLDVYERARDAVNELKAALPSATGDIERLLGRINAAYWEVCGVPENEATPAPRGPRNRRHEQGALQKPFAACPVGSWTTKHDSFSTTLRAAESGVAAWLEVSTPCTALWRGNL
jgi:hypothetical protein